MKKTLLLLAVLGAALLVALPAGAITNGSLDGNAHPYVGLMVAKDASGTPLWRCTGTLVSPTVFVTAGHCTEAPAATAEIWWDSDVQSNAAALGYPFTGESSGTVHENPSWDPNAFWVSTRAASDDHRGVALQVPAAGLTDGWAEAVAHLMAPVLRNFEPDLRLDADWVRTQADRWQSGGAA